MKNLFLSAFIIVIALVASCGKDKDESKKENPLLGTWEHVSTTDCGEKAGTCKPGTYIVISEKEYEEYSSETSKEGCRDYHEKLNYTHTDKDITFTSKEEQFTKSYTFVGDVLTFTLSYGNDKGYPCTDTEIYKRRK